MNNKTLSEQFLGRKYPVRSVENGEVVGYRDITKVTSVSNRPMFLVYLDHNNDSPLAFTYLEIDELLQTTKE